ncbi:uncharacterized protein E0L32_003126 [Thyridium curvatum]|uniref:Uncharacterized protein n=1 Tax=Thyridium curvatum TaxID=1093900 RepID=A0A507BD69_9PEZI|nr:uncharacterized protein E0L32_003126 [Thyridium curvatum]TPX17483.1 hypothetical protein E0L32_003126 [Thyridium curvatum]
MGGSRFATGPDPLYTPRMPPAIYETVKERCRDVLSELFERVGSPIEGPGKRDHGDIDMLVAVPKGAMASALAGKDESSDETADEENSPSNNDEISNAWDIIAAALGAVRMAKEQDRAANLAVPWPDDLEPEHDDDHGADDPGTTAAKKHIQVDVRICASVEELDWMLFKHAHGDIWNLLGSTIRPYGLTIDETALSIRVPEIERSNKRLARVELSRDPAAVLAFLGLRRDGFWDRPFASLDAMFEYAATCRLFWVRPPAAAAAAADSSPGDPPTTTARLAGLVGSDEGRAGLKANDRKRMATRPAFRAWQDEFIPACRAAGRFAPDPPSLTADEVAARVRTDAFAAFPGVREVFEARRDEFVAGRQREDITKAIRTAVPRDLDPWLRGRTVSALKKIVLLGDDEDGFGVAPDFAVRDDRGFWDVEKVVGWVGDHWEDVLGTQITVAAAAAAEDKDGRCLARRE